MRLRTWSMALAAVALLMVMTQPSLANGRGRGGGGGGHRSGGGGGNRGGNQGGWWNNHRDRTWCPPNNGGRDWNNWRHNWDNRQRRRVDNDTTNLNFGLGLGFGGGGGFWGGGGYWGGSAQWVDNNRYYGYNAGYVGYGYPSYGYVPAAPVAVGCGCPQGTHYVTCSNYVAPDYFPQYHSVTVYQYQPYAPPAVNIYINNRNTNRTKIEGAGETYVVDPAEQQANVPRNTPDNTTTRKSNSGGYWSSFRQKQRTN